MLLRNFFRFNKNFIRMRNYCRCFILRLKNKIVYYFQYFLYKMGILKRYTYKNNVDEILPCNLCENEVITKYIKGIVTFDLISYRNTEIDYFYINKKGKTYITLYLINKDICELYARSGLKDIKLSINKVWYPIHNKFIMYDFLLPPSFNSNKDEFDLKALENIQCKSYIGTYSADNLDIPLGLQENCYEYNFKHIKKYLDDLKFYDFIK